MSVLTPVDGEWRLTADLATLASSVPITARELIEKRLASLRFDERQTLEAASVLGAEFILHAAQFSVFENSWNFKVIKVCILLLKRVPRSRRQVSMLSLKVANLS